MSKNKFRWSLLTAASFAVTFSAHAQVAEIYGVATIGVATISDVAGGRHNRVQNAGHWSTNFGIRGSEDLGGGLKALFNMNAAFNADDGNIGNAAAFWSNGVAVGLGHERYGTVSAGRQFDFMVDLLSYANVFSSTVYAFHPGSADRINGVSVPNAMRYESPRLYGVAAKGMYALGEGVARHSYSAEASYEAGPVALIAIRSSIGSTTIAPASLGLPSFFGQPITSPAAMTLDRSDIDAAGVKYKLGDAVLKAAATRVKFVAINEAATETLKTAEVAVTYNLTPALVFDVGAWQSKLGSNRWTTFNTGLDYFFSKRTDVMLGAAVQSVSGPNQRAALFGAGVAAGQDQNALYLGIRHRF